MSSAQATVEQVVRSQLAKALGGRRGIVESAVPTALFTICFLVTDEIRLSLWFRDRLAASDQRSAR